jgi:hypothetical protein
MTILVAVIASLQIAASPLEALEPCATTGVLLVVGVDQGRSPGAWSVTVCRDGAFVAESGRYRNAGRLAAELRQDLRTHLAALPAHQFGQLLFEGWTLRLMVPDGAVRRTYSIGQIRAESARNPPCAAVLPYLATALGVPSTCGAGRCDRSFAARATAMTRAQAIEVFCDDPDAFVARAVAAGAHGRAHGVRDYAMPWGTHRQGGFTDPFGHVWFVGDRPPLSPHP